MITIKNDAFLGTVEKMNEKLEALANLAQPEIWTYKEVERNDPYKILRNYFFRTYDRLKEENKLAISKDGQYLCMNTGLLTKYNQEIVAVFSKNTIPNKQPWFLNGFFEETEKIFTTNFSELPQLANYYDNISDLIFDYSLEINLKKEHIIDDNFQRFVDAGYSDKELINVFLESARNTLKKKLRRNFKLASPFFYHNTETGDNKIQLLAPLYFPGSPVRLALVLNKIESAANKYYEGITVLPIELAYMNSRLIAKPDEEWSRILKENISEDSAAYL